ncbi:nitroreductase/quinone reductase family protein [Rhodococcus sp. IEGM 1401]|uniref:nitroreductase/quinone reductase family protein n=1 Tax=unclassified Rhodococcus (in: high G+C Gram-positive bacteria) TaxID=192944 RepID=UPI0022B2C031|nr:MULTISPECIES: nitroreductase/quinone reductase family protein [unclassified Rhodococcus (in: high G+C Gram-positive bacteria)]MCZ4562628.1 nitroreductase/quinone reductase family protein [Rhodococcus sp. IEGM 1401]MDI9922670.1 nitroreductase/quinone reductase family protein [Rhodococcus sp. IEGM 1372]MDV8035169.1 nitroreductase/quinone reductase family protein [Rhodococcus sp. IEGM 1414]
MNTFQKSAAAFNKIFVVVMRAPVLDRVLGRSMGILTYTGRKSGKKFSLPVAYKRTGNHVKVAVAVPDKKNWWRNFEKDGGRVDVDLGGVHHSGLAVATRDDRGRVTVDIDLER